jgi:hypothetical protein
MRLLTQLEFVVLSWHSREGNVKGELMGLPDAARNTAIMQDCTLALAPCCVHSDFDDAEHDMLPSSRSIRIGF